MNLKLKPKQIKFSSSYFDAACYVCDRLREPSTWRGIIWVLTACGYVLTNEQANSIITLGMALAGFIGIFTSDAAKKRIEKQM